MVSFKDLWDNHPNITGEGNLLDDKTYPDQCAVELYASLQRAGVDLQTFYGQMSWQPGKPKYAIRAEELAEWLSLPTSIRVKPEKYPGDEAFKAIAGRSGIVFFRHYLGPQRQGNHIDPWNGSYLTARFTSWVRIHLYIVIPGTWSNFRDAQSIWFWYVP